MRPHDFLKIAEERDDTIEEIYTEQFEMAQILYESMLQENTIQVIQGPTGMGKTIVIAANAAALRNAGKRVLIAVPTYTHMNDNTRKALELIDQDYSISYGLTANRYQNLKCPKPENNHSSPNQWICSNHAKECRGIDCLIVEDTLCLKDKQIVLTTHAKIISKPSILNEYDCLIIDESHSLPSTIQSHQEKLLPIESIQAEEEFLQEQGVDTSLLRDALTDYAKIKERSKRGKRIPALYQKRILQKVQEFGVLLQKKHPTLLGRAEMKAISEIILNAYQKTQAMWTGWGFIVFGTSRKPIHKESLSVGLISATIDDPRDHAKDCGFVEKILRPPKQFIKSPRFRRWFEHRPIYGLLDGPNLATNYNNPEAALEARKASNEIISSILKHVNYVSLVLCRNQRDASSVRQHLEKFPSLRNRLFEIEESSDIELDQLEDEIAEKVSTGAPIILATASSRLWEGANVPRLKVVLIDALPYPRPSAISSQKGRRSSEFWKAMFRFMLNRLQQGVGRLVRREGEWGIAIIIDGRLYANRGRLFAKLPDYFVAKTIFRWRTSKALIQEIPSMITRLESGEDARLDENLEKYLHV